jgi:uncharacterized protein (TIGR02246 family)
MSFHALMAAAGLALCASVQDDGARAADEAAIRGLIERAARAWADGDGEAYAAVFAPDADYVTFGGMHLEGREPIARVHQQLFDGPLAGSRLALTVKKVRFLGPDAAIAHVDGGIVEGGRDELTDERRSMQTVVAARRDGEWRVAATQVTRVQPLPPRD